MYFPDLSPYPTDPDYGAPRAQRGIAILSVGWLSKHEEYLKAPTSEEFQARLMIFVRRVRTETLSLGWHPCEFCGEARGNGLISVTSGRKIYMSPVMVVHYVLAHEYCPPPEFQAAVLAGPLPDLPPTFVRPGGETTTFGRCPCCKHLLKLEGLPFKGARPLSCGRCGETLQVASVGAAKVGAGDEYRIDVL
jgi:hypothetical protein